MAIRTLEGLYLSESGELNADSALSKSSSERALKASSEAASPASSEHPSQEKPGASAPSEHASSRLYCLEVHSGPRAGLRFRCANGSYLTCVGDQNTIQNAANYPAAREHPFAVENSAMLVAFLCRLNMRFLSCKGIFLSFSLYN